MCDVMIGLLRLALESLLYYHQFFMLLRKLLQKYTGLNEDYSVSPAIPACRGRRSVSKKESDAAHIIAGKPRASTGVALSDLAAMALNPASCCIDASDLHDMPTQ